MELTILIVRGELREGVYLVRDEMDLSEGFNEKKAFISKSYLFHCLSSDAVENVSH